MNILLAVDGSPYTKKMLAYLAAHPELLGDAHAYTVLHVQPQLPPRARAALGKDVIDKYHAEEGEKVLAPVLKYLARQGVAPKTMVKVGSAGETIAKVAQSGRFDLIVLHMHLVLQRLQQGFQRSPGLRPLSRILIETYFADMDRSLCEMGVGDTGVSYRVQKMSSAFYGRLEAYGMAGDDPKLWPEALRRNLYGTSAEQPKEAWIIALMAYIEESKRLLEQLPDDLTSDSLVFAPLPEKL